MRKTVVTLMLACLLIGVNAFAAGDLIVNGTLGVGTSSPLGKLDVTAADASKAIFGELTLTNSPLDALYIGAFYSVVGNQTGIDGAGYIGFQGQVGITGSGIASDLIGTENIVFLNSTVNSTVINGQGNTAILRKGSLNTAAVAVNNYYGFHSYGSTAGSGSLSGTNWRHAYFENLPSYGGTVTNLSGLWIDKQTRGTNNYGVVLNGDGVGSDIVFGTARNVKLYSNAGDLYVKDAANNVTLLGPHDPETGEWIFYSQNIKTGKTVRVNMEKLVKAVEKLTGEQFMVETLMEEGK